MVTRCLAFMVVVFSVVAVGTPWLSLEAQPPAAAAAAGPATKAYQAKLAEWKDMLRTLQALRTDFIKAKPDEVANIRMKWATTIKLGDTLLPELRQTAKHAFVEAPNEDRQLGRLLMKLIEDATGLDQYEIVADLSGTMLEHGSDMRILHDYAGIAHFALHDFEKAAQHFGQAKVMGVLSGMGTNFYGEVKDYEDYWAEEQKLRAAEKEADDLPQVKLVTTKGEIIIELFENEAPDTVGNFISLVENGFYEDNIFHRVLPNFMAQVGSLNGDGSGDIGYEIYSEFTKPEARKHFRGTLSMANKGPNTGSSQFFITFRPTANLNGKHTVFGRVIKGLEILATLQRINPEMPNPTITADKIIQTEVIRMRDHDYVARKVKR